MDATSEFPARGSRSALIVDLTNLARTHWQAMIGNKVPLNIAMEKLAGDVIGRIMATAWKFAPALLILAVDSVGRTRRHHVWDAYKGTRARPDPEFTMELTRIREWFKYMRVPVLYDDGVEADDQIGTVVARIRMALTDAKVLIWSGDHDMLQLVDESTRFWNGRTELAVGPADVMSNYRVHPEQFADFLALVGDKDEAPGVPGIGAVGAAKLLGAHGTLEAAIEAAKYRSGREYEALSKNAELARLSLKLVTLHRDAPSALSMTLADAMYGWERENADDAAAVARRVQRDIIKYKAFGKPAPFWEWEQNWAAAEGLPLERAPTRQPTIVESVKASSESPAQQVMNVAPPPTNAPPKQLGFLF